MSMHPDEAMREIPVAPEPQRQEDPARAPDGEAAGAMAEILAAIARLQQEVEELSTWLEQARAQYTARQAQARRTR
jgi:hypothetical protein